MNVIKKILLPTANRGEKMFLISENKGGYFSHEVGEVTKWAKLFESDPEKMERESHRINPQMRYGNQYKRSLKPKPFKKIEQAIEAAKNHAQQNVIYC